MKNTAGVGWGGTSDLVSPLQTPCVFWTSLQYHCLMSICSMRNLTVRCATRLHSNLSYRYQNVFYSSQRNTSGNAPHLRSGTVSLVHVLLTVNLIDGKQQGNTKEQPIDYYQAVQKKTNDIYQKYQAFKQLLIWFRYIKDSPKFDKDRMQELKTEITKEVGELRKEWIMKTKEGKDPNVINVSNKRP